ncbi:MAG TPA: hypothetical protein VGN67_12525 [Telluribacter sp.]|nr:hypothetical protein [Telluribacter sp.]
MKKSSLLLLILLGILSACQKRQYPQMSKPQFESFGSQKATPAQVPAPPVAAEAPAAVMASSAAGVEAVLEATNENLAAMPAEAIKALPVAEKAPVKLNWKERLVAKKLEKKMQGTYSLKRASATGTSKTIPLLSLVFGGLGLLMLLLSIIPGLAILFGIAGLVLGIVGLGEVRKGKAPRSSKFMALLGLIFGAGVIVLLLAAVIFIAAFGFA